MSTMMIVRTVLEILALNGKNSLTAFFGGKVGPDRIRCLLKVAALIGSIVAGVALVRLAMLFGPVAAEAGAVIYGSIASSLVILPIALFAVLTDRWSRITSSP
jgi:hypothetical protein